jgi:hypothetical protein
MVGDDGGGPEKAVDAKADDSGRATLFSGALTLALLDYGLK